MDVPLVIYHVCVLSRAKGLIVETEIELGSTERAELFFMGKSGVVEVRVGTVFKTLTITVNDYITFTIPRVIP